MDESLQQGLALLIVALAVAVELLRRYRKKKAGKPGCDGCDSASPGKKSSEKSGETPLKFYKKR